MDAAEMPAAVEALDQHLVELERRGRAEGGQFWQQEESVVFEATNLAFLIRCLRNLLLILTTEHYLLEDFRMQAAQRASRGWDVARRLPARPRLPFQRYRRNNG